MCPEVTFGSSSLTIYTRQLFYIIFVQSVYILILKMFKFVTQTSLLLYTDVPMQTRKNSSFQFTLIISMPDHYSYIPTQIKSFSRLKKLYFT